MKKILIILLLLSIFLLSGCNKDDVSTRIIKVANEMDELPYIIIDCSLPDINKTFEIVQSSNDYSTYNYELNQVEFCKRLLGDKT